MLYGFVLMGDLAVGGPFALISKSTLDNYRASLTCEGYSEADFEVTERVDPHPRSTTDSWGFVIVTRKLAGIQRHYRTGPSLCWADAFDADLKLGVYLAASPDLPPKVVLLRNPASRW